MVTVRHFRKWQWKESSIPRENFISCILICDAKCDLDVDNGHQSKYQEQVGHCIKLTKVHSFFSTITIYLIPPMC